MKRTPGKRFSRLELEEHDAGVRLLDHADGDPGDDTDIDTDSYNDPHGGPAGAGDAYPDGPAAVDGTDDDTVNGDALVDVDAVLDTIGEFGWFQKRHYLHLSYPFLVNAIVTMQFVFVSPSAVPWRCRDPDGGAGANNGSGSGSGGGSGGCNSSAVFSGEAGMETLCAGGLQSVHSRRDAWEFVDPDQTVTAEFGLVCEDGWKAPMLASLYFVGFGVGSPVWGVVCDRIGRKKTVLLTQIGTITLTFMSALCSSFGSYAVVRLLIGGFSIGWTMSAFTLNSEFLGSKHRGKLMMLTQAFFSAGEVVLAAVAFRIRPWRSQTFGLLLLYIPTVVMSATILYESPRWLLLKGDVDAAVATLKEVARVNGTKYPDSARLGSAQAPPRSRFTPPPSPNRPNGRGRSPVVGGGGRRGATAALPARAEPLSLLFTHPELRRRQLVMMFGWFTCSIVFYGISIAGSGLTADPYTDFTWQAVAEVPGIVLAMYALDWHRTGRKGALVLTFAESAVSMLLLMMMVDSEASVRTVLAFCGKLGISAAFAIVYVLPVELIPTGLRAGSMGLCSMVARVGGILAPFVVLLGGGRPALPFLVFAVPAGMSAVFTLLLPETLGKPLPQTLADVTHTVSVLG